MNFTRRTVLAASAAALAAAALAAHAAGFPDKPVRIAVGFAAGGGADIVARQLGHQMGAQVGQSFVVENKPGATGTIAASFVAKAPADGHTLFLGSQSTMLVAPAIYPKLPFDPVQDFTPVSMLVSMPMLLVVHPSVPARTVQELVELAKKGDLSYASAGAGGPQHTAGELFANLAKIKLTHIPYKGEAPALTDAIGGQVPVMFSNLPAVMPYVKAGKLRALAVSSARRHPELPDLPTVAEAGKLPGFEVLTWYGVFAPAGTPPAVVKKLETEAIAALKSKELSGKLADQGFTVVGSTSQQFAAFMKSEVPRWSKLIKDANIRAD
ncbi:tripartite tricarboxylate transporter substrate binding protein [Ramlibacter montanisoli]|uniref:Tripartite tricarboxylate transporter substrate binding protein n=1 Tax=Ramlibacter montanisoli TaxID=2732512 RepID=A0A849KQA4_9BURK|nr:tripartite tricarboxylate transporter substrate binding protein [Ramlibacter montanisoli]NNU43999.1 tripartite tricarboxylate transporter substrate binding protein [Ramlibacter montanisoli]